VDKEQVNGWKSVVNRAKQHDVKIIAQLMHAGALREFGDHSLAPSPIRPVGERIPGSGSDGGPYPFPKEMSTEDIETAVAGYVLSAVHARQAGFDGIEIHAANGYLPDQFLTPYSNQRTDEYGGKPINRFRFIAEIAHGIRQMVQGDFIVGLRLSEGKVNNLSYRFPDGPKTAIDILNEVAKLGLSYVHIAAEGGGWERECLYADGRSFSGLAKEITGKPVIANGGLDDLEKSKFIIEQFHGDLISIGKAAIADPSWPSKIEKGEKPFPFHRSMIKPYHTLEHTKKAIEALTKNRRECA
jgi:2,4-dienoyl-CoA reductase-like NADH-dependent reductase (Old Yellow Enzyme family)